MLDAAPNVGPGFRHRRLGHFRNGAAYEHYLHAYDRALAQLPPPAQTLDVPTTFGTVRAYCFGPDDRVPVLLLPGRMSATPMWKANLAGFARHRRVWAIDLLGEAGLSVQTRPLADADDEAAWLAELLDALNLDAVHLLGLSIGGWLALNLATRRPGKLASLILLEPAYTFAPITWKVVAVSFGCPPAPARRRAPANPQPDRGRTEFPFVIHSHNQTEPGRSGTRRTDSASHSHNQQRHRPANTSSDWNLPGSHNAL